MEGEKGRGAEHLAVSWRGGKGDSCCRDGAASSFDAAQPGQSCSDPR